jgi:large repetitive protein
VVGAPPAIAKTKRGRMTMAIINGTNGGDNKGGTLYDDIMDLRDGSDWGFGYDGNDEIYGGKGADNLYGGYGNDYIQGGPGNDYLSGGDGNDTIVGDLDNDVMYGWSGADTFVWTSVVDWWGIGDTIGDFNHWEGDRIDLRGVDAKAYSFSSPSTWGDQAFSWKGYTGATNISLGKGELAYFQNGENTILYGNVDGDSGFELVVTLTGTVTLFESDFYL